MKVPSKNPESIEEPKDLKVKIGTPDQVLWEQVKKETEGLIDQCKRNLIVQTGVLELAISKIEIEKAKMKS